MSLVLTPTFSQKLSAALAEARLQLLIMSRYPGQLAIDVLVPVIFASMPILLGQSLAGPQAAATFEANTGTTNYVAYLLIGSNVFMLVSGAFWHIGYAVRREQEVGTLEAVYLAPASRLSFFGGVALYSALRGLLVVSLGYLIGCAVYQVNPFTGDVALALLFIAVGLVPLYGVTLLFGALVLQAKEANALNNLLQWVVSFLMGIFFPVAVLPPFVRALALLFPPTWMTNGVRSALLGVGYFFGQWYLDLAVLWTFLLFAPLLSLWVFTRVERRVMKNAGVGQF